MTWGRAEVQLYMYTVSQCKPSAVYSVRMTQQTYTELHCTQSHGVGTKLHQPCYFTCPFGGIFAASSEIKNVK